MSLTADQVAGIVGEIKTELAKERESLTAGLEHARRAGELLLKAKGQHGYGTWEDWLDENFELSERSAEDYIRLAKHWPDIQAALKNDSQAFAGLSFAQRSG